MNERLLEVIKYYGLNISNFSDRIGVKEGTIRKVITSNTTVRSDTLLKISKSFTSINIDWLITGRGSMFYNLNENDAILQASDSQIVKILLDKNESLIRENDRLQNQIKELQKKIAHCDCASTSMETSIS